MKEYQEEIKQEDEENEEVKEDEKAKENYQFLNVTRKGKLMSKDKEE